MRNPKSWSGRAGAAGGRGCTGFLGGQNRGLFKLSLTGSCPTMSFVFVCLCVCVFVYLCKRLTPVVAQPDVKAGVGEQKGEAVLGSGHHLGRELRLLQTYLSQGHNPLCIGGD